MANDIYPINIWVNEERFEKLRKAGLGDMSKDVLAGMRVIQVPVTSEQKDQILKKFPSAKCDTATTKTIELLPKEIKDKIFDLVVESRNLDVIGKFIKSL